MRAIVICVCVAAASCQSVVGSGTTQADTSSTDLVSDQASAVCTSGYPCSTGCCDFEGTAIELGGKPHLSIAAVVDDAGVAHVASFVEDNTLVYAKSGGTPEAAELTPLDPVADWTQLSLALDVAGIPHAAVSGNTQSYAAHHLTKDGIGWQAQLIPTAGEGLPHDVAIAVDTSGTVHVVVSFLDRLEYTQNDGATWSSVEEIVAVDGAAFPSVTMSEDRLHLSFVSGGVLFSATRAVSGWSVTEVTQELNALRSSIAAWREARYIAFLALREGAAVPYLATSLDGVEWTIERLEDGRGGQSSNNGEIAIAIAPNDELVVAVYVREPYPDLSELTLGRRHPSLGWLWQGFPDLRLVDLYLGFDGAGRPHLVYFDRVEETVTHLHVPEAVVPSSD